MMAKKVLLIGGTGTISSSVTRMLAKDPGYSVTVMNRGHKSLPDHVRQIICDVSNPDNIRSAIGNETYDAIADFIVYTPQQAQERVNLFKDRTVQYLFISTVVVFNHENEVWMDENSPQGNAYSQYGRDKQACEKIYMDAYHEYGFPVTIVRPSQTYGYDRIPLSIKGNTCFSTVSRILKEKPVIVHGDGKSLWHMMHTFDFAYDFIQLIGNPEAIGKSVNLVNPDTVTWDMIYRELGKQLHHPVHIIHIASDTLACSSKYKNAETFLGDKQYSNLYMTSALKELIPDFRCHVDLQQGIAYYISYMREHNELQIPDPEFDTWCDMVIRDYLSFMSEFGKKY
jgi:nucleoside-diphosphate-sugar epimerase